MEKTIFCFFAFVLFAFIIVANGLRVSKDYQRVAVFRTGKFVGVRGPGIFFLIPFIERAVMVDLRPTERKYDDLRLTTKDKDRIILSWSWKYRIVDPEKAFLSASNFETEMEKEVPSVVQNMSTDEIVTGVGRVEANINDRFVEIASRYGVQIENVQVLNISSV